MEPFYYERDFTLPGAAALYGPGRDGGFVTEENAARCPALQIPELGAGFVPAWWYAGQALTAIDVSPGGCRAVATPAVRGADLADGRALPLCYKIRAPRAGVYRVTVELLGEAGAGETLLFCGRRRLAWRGVLREGERREITFAADVSPIIPRGHSQAMEAAGLDIALVSQTARLRRVRARAAPGCRRLLIAGDSTVADQSAETPYAPAASYCGWGQMLPALLPGDLCVSNHAHSGLTSESFRGEGHYEILRGLARPGDICLIQFGHNDQKLPHLLAGGGYRDNLKRYIAELRAAGAAPALITPLARNSWRPDGAYQDFLAPFAEACRRLAGEEGVPLLDLHAHSVAWVRETGLEAAKAWFYPADYTHLNDFGGYRMAAYLAQALFAHGLCGPPPPASPWPAVPAAPLLPTADTAAAPPPGAAGFFAEVARPDDILTRVEALEFVIKAVNFFPINVYNDLYPDVVGHETFAGTVQCAAQNGLIPPHFVADGLLHPHWPVTLEEFLLVLLTGYASRRTLTPCAQPLPAASAFARQAARLAVGAGLVTPRESWQRPITRAQAASLYRRARI